MCVCVSTVCPEGLTLGEGHFRSSPGKISAFSKKVSGKEISLVTLEGLEQKQFRQVAITGEYSRMCTAFRV